MPELPEVETVVQGIKRAILGRTITSIKLTRSNMRYPFPEGLDAVPVGHSVESVERKAKYILIHLTNNLTLILHLGMSGRVLLTNQNTGKSNSPINRLPIQKHDHFIMHFSDDTVLTFNDARRFGFVDMIRTDLLKTSRHFKTIGIEPFDQHLTPEHLFQMLNKSKTSIKSFLLNQKNIVGIGNIYACEILFLSRIHPEKIVNNLSFDDGCTILSNIHHILNRAIMAGGSTLKDYTLTDGTLGRFQFGFKVYDRENEPCPNKGCKSTIKRIIQNRRSTFYCPSCQKNA